MGLSCLEMFILWRWPVDLFSPQWGVFCLVMLCSSRRLESRHDAAIQFQCLSMWVAMKYHPLLTGWRACLILSHLVSCCLILSHLVLPCLILYFDLFWLWPLTGALVHSGLLFNPWFQHHFAAWWIHRWLQVSCTTLRVSFDVFWMSSFDVFCYGQGCRSLPASGTPGSTQSPDTLRCN